MYYSSLYQHFFVWLIYNFLKHQIFFNTSQKPKRYLQTWLRLLIGTFPDLRFYSPTSSRYNNFWLIEKIVASIEVSICVSALCTLLKTSIFFYQINVVFLTISIFIYITLYCINILLFDSYITFQSIKSFLIVDRSLNAIFKLDYTPWFGLFYI